MINSLQIYKSKNFKKNSFHSTKMELKDTTGEKNPFVSVGITQIFL